METRGSKRSYGCAAPDLPACVRVPKQRRACLPLRTPCQLASSCLHHHPRVQTRRRGRCGSRSGRSPCFLGTPTCPEIRTSRFRDGLREVGRRVQTPAELLRQRSPLVHVLDASQVETLEAGLKLSCQCFDPSFEPARRGVGWNLELRHGLALHVVALLQDQDFERPIWQRLRENLVTSPPLGLLRPMGDPEQMRSLPGGKANAQARRCAGACAFRGPDGHSGQHSGGSGGPPGLMVLGSQRESP